MAKPKTDATKLRQARREITRLRKALIEAQRLGREMLDLEGDWSTDECDTFGHMLDAIDDGLTPRAPAA